MEIKNKKNGFALIVAVIFMSVMLSFGLALSSLGYKQAVLASSALESQYAFYAADGGLECALYADQQQNLFAYTSNMSATAPVMNCDGIAPYSASVQSHTASSWTILERLSIDAGTSRPHCADITIIKPNPSPTSTSTTYIYSQGYDVSCDTVASPGLGRYVTRALGIRYSSSVGALP